MQVALKENTCEAFEGVQAMLVETTQRCPPDVLPHALQCLLALRVKAARGASLQLGQAGPSHDLVALSGGTVKSHLHVCVHSHPWQSGGTCHMQENKIGLMNL